MRAFQVHPAAGGEAVLGGAVTELHVTGGPEPPRGEGGQVAAGQADSGCGGLAEVDGLVEVAVLQQQGDEKCASLQVERAGDAGAEQPKVSRLAATSGHETAMALGTEQ